MKSPIRLRHLPGRLAAGAFILNSGLSKRNVDEEHAAQLHGMATNTYPFLGKLDAVQFTKILSTSEIALGAALLTPFIPTAVVGAGLAAFSGGLLGLYLRTPGLREEGSLRPTEQGVVLAKDVWLFALGLGFALDGMGED